MTMLCFDKLLHFFYLSLHKQDFLNNLRSSTLTSPDAHLFVAKTLLSQLRVRICVRDSSNEKEVRFVFCRSALQWDRQIMYASVLCYAYVLCQFLRVKGTRNARSAIFSKRMARWRIPESLLRTMPSIPLNGDSNRRNDLEPTSSNNL